MPRFMLVSVRMGFVVHRVTMGQVFVLVLQLLSVSIIPLEVHTHISSVGGVNNRPVGDRSSQTQSHPINMNMNNKKH
jgi:hypothetical protein